MDSTTESGDAGSTDWVAVPPAEVAPGEFASCLSGEANNNKSPKGVWDESLGSLGEEVLATCGRSNLTSNEETPARSPDLPEKRLSAQGMELSGISNPNSRLSLSKSPIGFPSSRSAGPARALQEVLRITESIYHRPSAVDILTSTDLSSQEREILG